MRRYDDRSDEARVWRKLYNSKQWRTIRLHGLRIEPLCCMCMSQGLITSATVRDHIKPHKGDETLFWDIRNHQSLCKPHHDASKQRQEARHIEIGCDISGFPTDPKSPWSNHETN